MSTPSRPEIVYLDSETPKLANPKIGRLTTAGVKDESSRDILGLTQDQLPRANSPLSLTPFGRAVLESSLRPPEAIESSILLMKSVWQGKYVLG